MARLERRGAVAGENPVAGLADVIRQALPHLRLAGRGVDQDAKHFPGRLPRQYHIPAEPRTAFVHRQPGEVDRGPAQCRRAERLLFLRTHRSPAGREIGGLHGLPEVPPGDGHGLRRGDRRSREPRRALRGAAVGGHHRVGEKLAGHIDEFAGLGRVRLQDRAKDRHAVHLLLPDHAAQAVVLVGVVALHLRGGQHLRAVAVEPLVFFDERLHLPMRLAFGPRLHPRFGHRAPFARRTGEKFVGRAHQLRGLGNGVRFQPRRPQPSAKLRGRRRLLRAHGRRCDHHAFIKIWQRPLFPLRTSPRRHPDEEQRTEAGQHHRTRAADRGLGRHRFQWANHKGKHQRSN